MSKRKIALIVLAAMFILQIVPAYATDNKINEDPTYYLMQQKKAARAQGISSTYGYSHNSKFADCTVIKGIDVSHHEGKIDWKKVASAGIKFAFIRVGYRGYSTGSLVQDTRYAENIKAANAAGIKVGVYIFSQAINTSEAKTEANYILSKIKNYKISMPVVFDYEFAGDPGRLKKANLSKTAATNVCLKFCSTVKAAGYEPVVYANKSMLTSNLNASTISSKYDIWLAHYISKTDYKGDYTYWQFTEYGKVDGISSYVDKDFWYYKPTVSSSTDNPVSISKTSVKAISNRAYTGKAIKPSPVVQYKNATLKKGTDYTLSYSDNQTIGKATVTVNGKGAYAGTKKAHFKIVPKKVTDVSSVSRTKSKIKVGWKKVSNSTGYQLYRSSAYNGTYSKIKTLTSNSATSYTNANLKSAREYYYKVRAYKTVDGTKYYGSFSSVKPIYTVKSFTRIASTKYNSYLRKYAGTSFSKVKLIPEKKKMSSVYCYTKDKHGDTWYKVKCTVSGKSYTGYIKGNLLSVKKK